MAKRLKKEDPLAGLPAWAQTLAQRYYTKTVNTFLLHGAVRDLHPVTEEDGSPGFGSLRSYLSEELFGGRDHVLFYDRSAGIRAANPETQKDLHRSMQAYDTLYGTEFAKAMPRDPGRALQILENFLRTRMADGKSAAVIIDFAETLVPGGDLSSLSAEDRFVLTTLTRWAHVRSPASSTSTSSAPWPQAWSTRRRSTASSPPRKTWRTWPPASWIS